MSHIYQRQAIYSIVFSKDGEKILMGGDRIILWDTNTGSQLVDIDFNAMSADISYDGHYALTGGYGMWLWDLTGGGLIREFGEGDYTHSVAFFSGFAIRISRILWSYRQTL